MKKIFLLTIAAATLTGIHAQQTDSAKTKPQLKLSLNYNSNLNYYGRTDSLRSSGFFPMAEFWVTPRFYVNAAPIFVRNAVQSMDYAGTVATAGYQYTDEKWLTHIYLLKPFYEESVRLVQSALKAQSGISFTRLNGFLNVTAGADLKYSDELDFGTTAGIDHIFRLEHGKQVFIIDPSLYAYAGTQKFSRTYTRKKQGFLGFPAGSEQVTESGKAFNILAWEASVPLIAARGRWMVLATPAYVMPKNLVTVAGRPDLSEQGKNAFYFTLAVKHSF